MSSTLIHPLERSEYVEQAYFYGLLENRIVQELPIQELLEQVHFEIAANTRLPMAIDFLLTELKHSGVMAPAMRRLGHYFTAFQTYLIAEAEREEGKFDMRVALKILQAEAQYRADGGSLGGLFFYQFEAICRNRLRYDPGLSAIAADPSFDDVWKGWILRLRRDIGLVDFADFLFLHSEEYHRKLAASGQSTDGRGPFIFGPHEGRIAFACRRRDPLYLFGALQRHLGYPAVPRVTPVDRTLEAIPQLFRKLEQLEQRLKLMEQENRAGIDITKFYKK
jgi:hypothetical protein